MKKYIIIVILLNSLFSYSQTGTLSGYVTDSSTKEPIPFANVSIELSDGSFLIGGETDFDGKYVIKPIPQGKYTVTASCANYATQKVTDVQILGNTIVNVDFKLDNNVNMLGIVEITEYAVPLIQKDNTVSGDIVRAKEISKMPARSSESTAAVAMDGVYSEDGKDASVRGSASKSKIKSGTLTSGEVNDFAKWHLWGNILKKDFQGYNKIWGFYPIHRYIAQLTNQQGMPISNAQVTLKLGNTTIWRAKTDNTGKAELWRDFFKSETKTDSTELKLEFEYEGKRTEISKVKTFEQGINAAQIKTACSERNKVDIFFMVDATGSMADEIRYLQVELDDIIQKIHNQQSELDLRIGSLVYRDHGDEYLTRKSSLSSDINETLGFLRKQSASGGGDYPEAVDVALEESVANEDWNDDALARILFIVLDAPSHTQPEVIARLELQLRLAAKKGIRIVPIACSDIQKNGEYLMRTFALATNGTYLFLTDDSGVGNVHIKPTTDKYDVEKLNDAIVRIIKQYTQMPDCNNKKWAEQNKKEEASDKFVPKPYDEKAEEGADTLTVSDIIKVYPNPCSDILKIEIKKNDVKDIYIVDMTGKTLYSFNSPAQKDVIDFDVRTLSTGIYFVRAFYKGKWFSEKIVKK